MRLYLLRHGIADHPGWSAPDSERPLNGEGIESLQKYGKRLTKWGVESGLILHSPYTRAKQTALIVAQGIDAVSKLREDARIAPGFDLDLLGQIIKENAAAAELMLVGHNPDFEEVASQMIGGGRIGFPKGALCCIDVDEGSRTSSGTLKWHATKKLLAK